MNRTSGLAGIFMAVVMLTACGSTASVSTERVQRGSIQVTVTGSGSVQPEQASDLTFGISGKVDKVLVKEGAFVEEGDVLAMLDTRELDQQVLQAEANLETARAKLQQTKDGNATEQDKQAAQANLEEAQATLARTRTGGVTQPDIANAQAAVRSAEANLQRAQTGNITAADIANAEAAMRSAEANLQRVQTGNITAADIADAEAAVRSAEAKLRAVLAGPPTEDVSAAQARLTQAKQNYQQTAATLSAAKTTAAEHAAQAADAVRLAQQAYSTAYWNHQQAQAGIDPRSGQRFADEPIISAILDPENRRQQYADALINAELELKQAESRLDQTKVAYENAKQQEITGLVVAQTQIDDAQVRLDELLKGPKEFDVAQAQAQVDQAKAQLAKLRAGGSPADVAVARAQLDQARAQLAKLRAGGSPADVANARAQLDQARAQLAKLRQGGMPGDIAVAGAQVEEAQALLDKLSAGATLSDQAIAEAGVRQAEAQLAAAQLTRDSASLHAPFSGVISAVGIAPGDRVSATTSSTVPFRLVDVRQLHLDINISEADVALIKEGQAAKVTIDALGAQTITGVINYIAPAGTNVQNVTTYRARVNLPANNPAIRVAMSGTVEIAVTEKQNVLVIPSRAIETVDDKHFVRLQRGNDFVETEIQTGLTNDLQTEVVSGLDEGDVIAARRPIPAQNSTSP